MIATARLLLRPWEPEDRPAFDTLFNTPAMMARLGGVQLPEAMDAIFSKRLDDFRRHGTCYWAAVLRESGALVGSCGVRVAENYTGTSVAGEWEAGWRIAEAWWRRGFAHEAAAASIAWLWANRPAPRVLAWTTTGNAASQAVMRAVGMVRLPELDFIRPGSGEACLVHGIERP
jgi:RimJ/RimL family protein N-acetyltransferase